MSEPLVCAVMLTKDRPAMAKRAVECFRAQTYQKKKLLVWDSSQADDLCDLLCDHQEHGDVAHIRILPFDGSGPALKRFSIGALRNQANAFWNTHNIIIHCDDDDWSHPNRIAEQVALLKSSGADCVGYNELLFWQARDETAWIYSNRNPALPVGASLCYWRAAWERQPFKDVQVGEDRDFCRRVTALGVSALNVHHPEPRLIQSLHGGNTWDGDIEAAIAAGSKEWTRAELWDAYAREAMKL